MAPGNASSRHFNPEKPINSSSEPSRPSNSRSSYPSRDQDTIQAFHRSAQSLYDESFYDITPDKATKYPCTKEELEASGGLNRRTAYNSLALEDKSKWFSEPNNGPFVGARIAAREIFDHSDPKRTRSATEISAIHRLQTGFHNAIREYWGPDLAIKTFCDLDQVFFCGRLKRHVCLTWRSGRTLRETCRGVTTYLDKGKCVIQLNSYNIFLRPRETPRFVCMFETLLHEMM